MSAPEITFSITKSKISSVPGYNKITVQFTSDIAYQAFQCRATKSDEDFGVGKGNLIAAFSQTPANTQRTFEIFDDYLLKGEGNYRISLFAQGMDGSWNDNFGFIPAGESTVLITADGQEFLCMREAGWDTIEEYVPLGELVAMLTADSQTFFCMI